MDKSERTALGNILLAQGVADWDEVFLGVCEKCSFNSLCAEAQKLGIASSCRAFAVIGGLAAKISARKELFIREFVQYLRELL